MIPVKFDPRTFARLADMAEAQGVTIGQLIEDAAQRLITGSTTAKYSAEKHRAALIARVCTLRKRGWTVVRIAHEVGYSKAWVSRLLTENGMRTRKARNGQEEGQA